MDRFVGGYFSTIAHLRSSQGSFGYDKFSHRNDAIEKAVEVLLPYGPMGHEATYHHRRLSVSAGSWNRILPKRKAHDNFRGL
jgi:hypothetical protein